MLNLKKYRIKDNSQKTAFSLVELSIVLIIIGLLVAGVTGGSSLIESAKLRGLMNEARGYSVAVNSFKIKFDQYPGDYKVVIGAITGNKAGDQNGKIEFVNGAATASDGRMESNIAWAQLKNDGFIDTTITPAGALGDAAGLASLVAGTNIPASKISSTAGWVFDNKNGQNVIILTGTVATTSALGNATAKNVIPTGAIKPVSALSVDAKMDDGKPNDGKIRSFGSLANCAVGTAVTDDYKTADTTTACAVSFQVDTAS